MVENGGLSLNFDKLKRIVELGLRVMPVVAQDWRTKEVLLLAYANRYALEQTLKTGWAVFWSTTRNQLWLKGKNSGNRLKIKEVRVNCEQNSLLYLVELAEGVRACHVKDKVGDYHESCFYRRIKGGKPFQLEFLKNRKIRKGEMK